MEKKLCSGKKKTGRKGMDLWHILVLAVVRHACGTNWDTLETWSNHHELVRRVMGVHATAFIEDEKIEFNYQTILQCPLLKSINNFLPFIFQKIKRPSLSDFRRHSIEENNKRYREKEFMNSRT